MAIKTNILDFKLSNNLGGYEAYMNSSEQPAMFNKMVVKTSYIGKSLEDPKKATVIFQGAKNVLIDIFNNPDTKPVVESSGVFIKVK